MEAHLEVFIYLEVKRAKVKVTRPINAVTDNASYTGRGITIFLFGANINIKVGRKEKTCTSSKHYLAQSECEIKNIPTVYYQHRYQTFSEHSTDIHKFKLLFSKDI